MTKCIEMRVSANSHFWEPISEGIAVPSRRKSDGFTLIELLVSIVILVAIMGILFSITQEVNNAWKNTTGKIEGFRNARVAFDAMTRTLSQATLNTYYDYVDASGNFRGSGMSATGTITQTFSPYGYARQSELHFICGQGSTLLTGMTGYTPVTQAIFFQAPLGATTNTNYLTLDKLLNACGFYVVYGPDPSVPSFLGTSYPTPRYRYRLMQFTQPADAMTVYLTSPTVNPKSWFTSFIVPTPDTTANFVLAENVVALAVWPKLSAGDQAAGNALTTDYSYDSRNYGTFSTANSSTGATKEWNITFNQLPPVIEVTMVAIDEASALKLGNTTSPPSTQLGLATSAGVPLLFTTATYPTTVGQKNQLELDLKTLADNLAAVSGNTAGNKIPLHFRVFQTEVSIRSAKWTTK